MLRAGRDDAQMMDGGRSLLGPRRVIATCACGLALALPAAASAGHSVGTSEQISWIRGAALTFVTGELQGGKAREAACSKLLASQRGTIDGRTCEQRLTARRAAIAKRAGGLAGLRADTRAIPTATVIVHGNTATIEVPTPLLNGSDELVWTEMCWMVKG